MQTSRPVDAVVQGFIRDKLEMIRREYAPRDLILFGSRAKGEAGEESDIDLIVVSDQFAGTRYVNRMGAFLIKVRPSIHVDALCYTPEEFDYMVSHGSPFIREALANGIRIE